MYKHTHTHIYIQIHICAYIHICRELLLLRKMSCLKSGKSEKCMETLFVHIWPLHFMACSKAEENVWHAGPSQTSRMGWRLFEQCRVDHAQYPACLPDGKLLRHNWWLKLGTSQRPLKLQRSFCQSTLLNRTHYSTWHEILEIKSKLGKDSESPKTLLDFHIPLLHVWTPWF